MNNPASKLLTAWRRQIATLRIINIWLVFAGVMSTFFLFHDFLPAVFRMLHSKIHDDVWRVGIACAGVMALVVGSLVWYVIMRSLQQDTSVKLPELQSTTVDAVATINRSLPLCRHKTIEVHVRKQSTGAPASIRQRRKKLVVIFRPDFAVLSIKEPRIACAFLAHELTHPFQWDTRFGHFWFETDRILAIAVGALAIAATLDLTRQAAFEILRHHYLAARSTLHYVAVEGLAFVSCIWATLWFFIVRRWAEYSADLSVVLAGYGGEIMDLLRKERASKHSIWRWFWRLSGPSNVSRLKRIERYSVEFPVPENSDGSMESGQEKMRADPRVVDYAAALFLRVVPFFLTFMSIGALFIALEMWIGNLYGPFSLAWGS